jgi:2-oxoglutarate dehydrogenase E2 component (dihydrolipoamide succinyltransferase)
MRNAGCIGARSARGETTMTIEIRVPTLGESVAEATVGKWLKRQGEAVKADEPLVELETDKVTVEVPAPAAGMLSEILVAEGTTVAIGAVLRPLPQRKARRLLRRVRRRAQQPASTSMKPGSIRRILPGRAGAARCSRKM